MSTKFAILGIWDLSSGPTTKQPKQSFYDCDEGSCLLFATISNSSGLNSSKLSLSLTSESYLFRLSISFSFDAVVVPGDLRLLWDMVGLGMKSGIRAYGTIFGLSKMLYLFLWAAVLRRFDSLVASNGFSSPLSCSDSNGLKLPWPLT